MMSLCGGGAITANSTLSSSGGAPDLAKKQNVGTSFQAFYPSVWGQGMPPPIDLIPCWGVFAVDVSE
jgi:hypothetical protein